MKLKLLFSLLILIFSAKTIVYAQVGIGTTTPQSSAQLEVNSTNKGFLPPRMSFGERNNIASPVAGLMIWCNNCGESGELQVYNGTKWTNMVGADAKGTIGSVDTAPVSNITSLTAKSGGYIHPESLTGIVAYGVCWSTNSGPTINNSKTTDNNQVSGNFVSNITGLQPLTTYYVRAYATNASGTSYGQEISFTTTSELIISTTPITNINAISATSGGHINLKLIPNGPSGYGVCLSTNPGPTINDTVIGGVNFNWADSTFISYITGLAPSTTYYVRAYVTSAGGTSYGQEVSFTTRALQIGDSYKGGKIAYILAPGDPGYNPNSVHGIIAAVTDLSHTEWGCYETLLNGANGVLLGTGAQNTEDIWAKCSSENSAGAQCFYYSADSEEDPNTKYVDWHLPSYDELYKLYLNKNAIGFFMNQKYWSSTQKDAQSAYIYDFSGGDVGGNKEAARKDFSLYVRPVQYF